MLAATCVTGWFECGRTCKVSRNRPASTQAQCCASAARPALVAESRCWVSREAASGREEAREPGPGIVAWEAASAVDAKAEGHGADIEADGGVVGADRGEGVAAAVGDGVAVGEGHEKDHNGSLPCWAAGRSSPCPRPRSR